MIITGEDETSDDSSWVLSVVEVDGIVDNADNVDSVVAVAEDEVVFKILVMVSDFAPFLVDAVVILAGVVWRLVRVGVDAACGVFLVGALGLNMFTIRSQWS